MTTLISWASSGGASGRCDAKCYGADSAPATCTCICGGVNHGAGLERATENTSRQAEAMIASYAGMPGLSAKVSPEASQQSLFALVPHGS
jgi:hypothetical protein